MRKVFKYIPFILAFIALGFVACSKYATDDSRMPSWASKSNEILQGVGSQKIENNNNGYARKIAITKAKAEIASNIMTRISDNTTITGQNGQEDAVTATRAVVEQALTGTVVEKSAIGKDDVYWVLVKVDKLDTKLLESNLTNSNRVSPDSVQKVIDTANIILNQNK